MAQAAIKAALEQENKDGTAALELAILTNKQANEGESKSKLEANDEIDEFADE